MTKRGAWVSLGDGVLRVGKDCVDCLWGPVVSRGSVTVGARAYAWASSFSWETAQAVIRRAARKQGLKAVFQPPAAAQSGGVRP